MSVEVKNKITVWWRERERSRCFVNLGCGVEESATFEVGVLEKPFNLNLIRSGEP